MGGITSGVGLFSGIDSGSLIEQLLQIESRPKVLAQTRLIQLQGQQAAYLDINTRLSAIQNLAKAFRTDNIFKNKQALVSNESILSATASQDALPGTYDFVVNRLVSTQQNLSRGFPTDTGALGLTSLTFEGAEARLDRDTSLSDLNNGEGITRGKITVNGTEVDLSTVGTVSEVLEKLNSLSGVEARVENDKFVITGLTSIENAEGREVLESLGLDGAISSGTLTGSSVYTLGTNTALESLNDGRGLGVRNTSGAGVYDFTIHIDDNTDFLLDNQDTIIEVRLGDIEELVDGELTVTSSAVTTVGGALDRINDAIDEAGLSANLTATINETTGGIEIVDSLNRGFVIEDHAPATGSQSTAAADLGIAGSHLTGSVSGDRIFAGMNTTLLSSLNGGAGIAGTDGQIGFSLQNTAFNFSADVSAAGDINDVINAINNDANNQDGFGGQYVTASLNEAGNGIAITDNTTGAGTFTVFGTGGADTAEALGISGTFTSGVAAGTDLDLAYIGTATRLDSMFDGDGLGTGSFEIIDSDGNRAEITISDGDQTLADVIRRINQNSSLQVNARINDTGDGLIIEDTGTLGGLLEINDTDGSVASKLRIAGKVTQEAIDADPGANFIDGSFETNLEFDANDSLEDVIAAINASDAGVSASLLNTGTGSAPFRISLASEQTGSAGRFLVDSGGFDLGLTTIDEGDDSRVFYGAEDPADGILISSSTNQLDGVIQGVSIDLTATSDESVQISISEDTESIEGKIQEFVDAFNEAITQIDFQTRYDQETEERGTLLGDGTVIGLRGALFNSILRENDGFTSDYSRLTDVGISIGSDSVLEFDVEAFRAAYADDPAAVEALFTRQTVDTSGVDDDDDSTFLNPETELEYSERGVMVLLEDFMETYTNSLTGVLTGRNSAFDDQIALQESRIESIDARLERRREVLGRQFLAMEQAIAGFQTQGNALSQISGLG
ncbi:MAG: flagellar filament capping protein FliD [Phycisphaerales bacterium]|nr:flagellar filament capping protein FliD [Phycisphaerales bacterium]